MSIRMIVHYTALYYITFSATLCSSLYASLIQDNKNVALWPLTRESGAKDVSANGLPVGKTQAIFYDSNDGGELILRRNRTSAFVLFISKQLALKKDFSVLGWVWISSNDTDGGKDFVVFAWKDWSFYSGATLHIKYSNQLCYEPRWHSEVHCVNLSKEQQGKWLRVAITYKSTMIKCRTTMYLGGDTIPLCNITQDPVTFSRLMLSSPMLPSTSYLKAFCIQLWRTALTKAGIDDAFARCSEWDRNRRRRDSFNAYMERSYGMGVEDEGANSTTTADEAYFTSNKTIYEETDTDRNAVNDTYISELRSKLGEYTVRLENFENENLSLKNKLATCKHNIKKFQDKYRNKCNCIKANSRPTNRQ